MALYKRGVITTGDLTTAGLFQVRNFNSALEVVTGEDENGNVATAQNFNPTKTVDIDAVLDTSATVWDGICTRVEAQSTASTPVTTTIGTEKFLVNSVTKNEGNKTLKRGTLNATRWTANGVPA